MILFLCLITIDVHINYSSINSEYICMLDTVKEQKRTHRIKYFGCFWAFQAFENQNFTDDVML